MAGENPASNICGESTSMLGSFYQSDGFFFPGKPSDLYDKTNPDWAPSIKLGYNNVKSPKDHSEKNICKEETDDEQLLWKQERSSSLDEEKPELPLIKEEWEEVFITEEVEQLELKQEIDAFMVTEDDQENMDSKPVLEENSRIRKSDSVTVQLDSPSHETSNSCKICGKVYIRSAYLETHMKTHMKTNSAVKSVFREIYPKPSGIFLVWATT
ncbi:transcriptional regulator CRZ1-like isoform X2 [Oryzias latipes]|uniref:transcriptional regulator CRZ1-like isoform X2 n=1 Tax=Oryzias latipes TaxID=8090 RepID=UPI000CE25350|nr:transcriptional regulator CRZ1-like isoform X2 [Oryzias latipes]